MSFDNTNYLPTNYRAFLTKNNSVKANDMIYVEGLNRKIYAPVYNNLLASKWAKGYVEGVHDTFLSFDLGGQIVNTLSDKVIGGGVLLDGQSDITKYFTEEELHELLAKIVSTLIPFGDCIAKLNIGNQKISNVDVIPCGQYEIETTNDNKVYQSTTYLNIIDSANAYEQYTLIEKRYFKKVKEGLIDVVYPFGCYQIEKWQHGLNGKLDNKELLKDVPDNIKLWLQKSNIEINKEVRLPFINSLGIYHFTNSWVNKMFPTSKVGESDFIGTDDLFYALDHAFTAKENDKYLGRGRCTIPTSFQNGTMGMLSGNQKINAINGSMNIVSVGREVPLDKTFYSQAPFGSMQANNKPEAIQFNLRTLEWRAEIEGLIGDIAAHFGITSSMLDSRLVGSGQKTATQICAEEDLTKATIEKKRALINKPLQLLLDDICTFYKTGFVKIIWSKAGMSNYSVLTDTVLKQYQQGLLSKRKAIEMLHPEWSKEEIDREIEEQDNEADKAPNDFDFTPSGE